MRFFIPFTPLLFVALLFTQCQMESGLRVSGSISGIQDNSIYFESNPFGEAAESLKMSTLGENGQFDIQLDERPEAGIYRIRTGGQTSQIILDGTEHHIELNTDAKNFVKNTYPVTGSPSSTAFNRSMESQYANRMGIDSIKTFIENVENPYAAQAYVSKFLKNRPDFVSFHQSVLTRLEDTYPTQSQEAYATYIKQMESQMNARQASSKVRVGQPAPEIVMPDSNGKERKLSDLKGKVVLIDFWASWCGPCRRANPEVVRIYNQYKDRGFDVYSVSLDGLDEQSKKRYGLSDELFEKRVEDSKQRWLAAIKKDGLSWDNHVSDLRKWDTPAARTYGVTGIPKTFLVDRDGKIAAVNPRFDLEEKLKETL